MVDVFFGDPLVSIDFHESEELQMQWAEANRPGGGHSDESIGGRSFGSQSSAHHRPSNLSTTSSSNQSTAGLSAHSTSGYSTTTATTPTNGQPSQQESFGLSSSSTNGTGGTLTHQSLALAHNHAQAVIMGTSGTSIPKRSGTQIASPHSKSASSRLSSRSIHAVSLQTDSIPDDSTGGSSNGGHLHGLRPGQHVWYSLKANKMHQIPTNSRRPPTDALLEMFLPWLYAPAMMPLAPEHRKYSEDVISQRSMSSAEIDAQSSGMSADVSVVNRRSFAHSTASSTDYPSPVATMTPSVHHPHQHQMPPLSHVQLADPDSIPSVDGVAAGRAQALAALCRIVCAKTSTERLSNEQLAQFLTVLHDALVERDRLMLCALIFYTTDLFKLGLPGVEVLLPNYAMAIDLVLTESFKLRLHPSISEVDMRHACLRSMAAIISWPTTFGTERIVPSTSNANSRLLHGSQNNLLTAGCRYIDIRGRTIKNLVHTLRTETDSMNLQLALGLCHAFCEESTRYDLKHFGFHSTPESARNGGHPKEKQSAEHEDEEQMFVVSALKRIVSAICDNLCKPAWSAELATLLATFDCLNAIAALPKSVLFHRMELSCGSLTVSSLCRFINTQLQKPPPHHSRDLHSSVVAAFQCLEVWLCAAPMLSEMESCIATVAHTIEFGMTGGNGLTPDQFKPASQRVYDAAESLQFTLFASVGSALDGWAVVDEQSVIRKLGDDNLSLDRFQHFVVDKSTVLSLHDITHVDFVSNGLPTLVMVARSPHRAAHASLIQLRPCPLGHESNGNKENSSPRSNRSASVADASNPLNSSIISTTSTSTVDGSGGKRGSTTTAGEVVRNRKQFEFPPGIHEPQCQLDASIKSPTATEDTRRVEDQLTGIRSRLAAGAGCAVGDRDAHNVWISSQLGALLCQPPLPNECVRKCNTIRVFLYDMGLINRPMFGNELIALDTSACLGDYHTHLHQLVDRQPAKRSETVSIFYVRADQTNPTEILQNAEDLRSTDSEFCTFVAQLGRARSVREPGFWTGHWQTAFAATPLPSAAHFGADDSEPNERMPVLHRLDGVDDCLWWTDAQLEVAFQLPTERSMQRNLGWANAVEQRHDDLMMQQQKSVPRYTPSSTASSLGPTSRTTSSLTGDASGKRNSDISASFAIPPTPHPGSTAATRTRSTSTINSDCSTRIIAPTAHGGDRQQNAGAQAVKRSQDQRIVVVWLERFEDAQNFPYEQLLPATDDGARRSAGKPQRADVHLIFVHNFEAGLVRVHVESVWTKAGQAGPLVDGVVVSTIVLPGLLRQTIANIARRKAVEVDQPTASYRRRQAIGELSRKFATPLGFTEFLDRFINV